MQSVDRAALIHRWAQDYEVLTSNDACGYLDPRGLDNLTRGLSELSIRGKYALTGSIAANRIAPIAPARLAMLYVDNVESAAAALKLRPTETGANVMLLAPFDDVVFERTWKDGGLTFVAASQTAVDCWPAQECTERGGDDSRALGGERDVIDPLYVACAWSAP